MSERWQRLLADFEAATAMSDEERRRFVDARRAEDPAAAAELERLLAADTGSGVLDSDPHRLLGALGLAEPGAAGEPGGDGDGDLPPTIGGVAPSPAAGVPAVIGRYQVLERIGRGGFGDVYRGFDPVLKRAVAIKTCLAAEPSVRERFVREAELAARLVHPNIVTVHDFGSDGEVPFLVQELLPGEDLSQRLGRRGGKSAAADGGGELSLGDKLRMLLDVAAGLAHAHAAGIVHRDVKPGNLRLLPDGRVKILDFGIARELGAGSVLTGDERAIGTLAYMAPEQARGELPDARADVHGWGAVAYELLSGTRAVPGDSPAALIFRLLDTAPPSLRQVAPSTPPELAALVDRCLEREPAKRPRDGAELLALLEPMARRLVPAEELRGPVGAWSSRRAASRKRRWIRWAAAAAVVAVAVLATRLAMRTDVDGVGGAASGSGAEAQSRAANRDTSSVGGMIADADRSAQNAAPPPQPGSLPSPVRTAIAPLSPTPANGAGAVAPFASPSASTPAASAAAAPVVTGTLQIDARPWGELVRLVAADGSELRLPDDVVTPLALVVPTGDYTATLRHPQGGERSCEAHVEAGARALCRAELRELRASELLGGGTP